MTDPATDRTCVEDECGEPAANRVLVTAPDDGRRLRDAELCTQHTLEADAKNRTANVTVLDLPPTRGLQTTAYNLSRLIAAEHAAKGSTDELRARIIEQEEDGAKVWDDAYARYQWDLDVSAARVHLGDVVSKALEEVHHAQDILAELADPEELADWHLVGTDESEDTAADLAAAARALRNVIRTLGYVADQTRQNNERNAGHN